MKECYISVDVETSGPIPGIYSMLAIGACVVEEPEKSFYIELQPITKAYVPAAMNTVGKPMEYFLKQGIDPAEALKSFREWLKSVIGQATPVFVGFNAGFDWSFINWYFHKYLNENPFGFSALDIKSYYMGLVGCTWEETRSSKIATQFSGSIEHTHNALDDAKEQAQMFRRMYGSKRFKM